MEIKNETLGAANGDFSGSTPKSTEEEDCLDKSTKKIKENIIPMEICRQQNDVAEDVQEPIVLSENSMKRVSFKEARAGRDTKVVDVSPIEFSSSFLTALDKCQISPPSQALPYPSVRLDPKFK